MSRQVIASLEARLSATASELELATFMNKGILATNTEHKLRIAELESENLILRKAETRLSRTEDRLEDTEKKLRALKGEKDDWEKERFKNGLERDRLKKDKFQACDAYWKLREKLENLLAGEEKMNIRGNTMPETSTSVLRSASAPGSGKGGISKREDHLTPVTKTGRTPASSKQNSRTRPVPVSETAIHSHQAEPSNVPTSSRISLSPIRPPTRAQSKKRRRVEDSFSADDEVDGVHGDSDRSDLHTAEDGEADEIGSDHMDERDLTDPLGGSNPYNQTPPSRIQTPLRPALPPAPTSTTKSNKKRISSTTKRREPNNLNLKSNQYHQNKPVVEVRIKNEPISPGNGASDSDDDPLAMI